MGVSGIDPSDNIYNNPVNADLTKEIEEGLEDVEKKSYEKLNDILYDSSLTNDEKFKKLGDLANEISSNYVSLYEEVKNNIGQLSDPKGVVEKLNRSMESINGQLDNEMHKLQYGHTKPAPLPPGLAGLQNHYSQDKGVTKPFGMK